jgi:predicted amidohydrolase
MTSTDRLAANMDFVVEAYQKAARDKAQLVVFPENSLFFRIQSGSSLQGPAWNGPELKRLSALVDEHKSAMMLTTALKGPSGKFNNSTLLFEAGRELRVVYSKIHLFDVDVPGAPPVRESDHFSAGENPAIVEIDGWKFGLTICYDLRFPELFLRYAQQVDCILVPSAFLVPTGEAHWHVLMRARAIESQCFVAAPAQAGEHISSGQKRQTYGHSLVIDPWGRILTELTGGTEVKTVELQKDQIASVRRQIPMAAHRRLKPV